MFFLKAGFCKGSIGYSFTWAAQKIYAVGSGKKFPQIKGRYSPKI
jgi:hypothetical protein